MAERKDSLILLLLLLAKACTAAIYGRPHIILILADDLVSTLPVAYLTMLSVAILHGIS
jgi:hypothetical protein